MGKGKAVQSWDAYGGRIRFDRIVPCTGAGSILTLWIGTGIVDVDGNKQRIEFVDVERCESSCVVAEERVVVGRTSRGTLSGGHLSPRDETPGKSRE